MKPRTRLNRPASAFALLVFAVVIAAAAWPGGVSAQQWPALKQGMWEFTRTMPAPGGAAPKVVTSKRCTDPTADMQRQNATLAKSGCTISAPARSVDTYTFTSSCKMMGISSNTKSTMVIESDSAYSITVDGTTDGAPTHEVMKARRTGDCGR